MLAQPQLIMAVVCCGSRSPRITHNKLCMAHLYKYISNGAGKHVFAHTSKYQSMPHPLPSPPPLSALNLEHSPASSSQLVLTHRNADRRSNAEIPSIVFSPTPVTHFDEQDELAFPILPTPSTSRSRVHSDSSLLLPEPPKPGGRSTSTPARKDQSSAPSPARTTPSPSHARQPPNAALTSRTDKGKAADHSPAVSHLRPPTSNATASPRPPVQNPSSPTPTRETRTRASSKNRRSWILKGDGAAL